MRHFTILALTFLITTAVFSQSKRVLFIGNSYTANNNLPLLTQNIALSFNDTLITDSNTPGGHTFNNHSTNATTLNKIALGTWDFVVLQAQSQEPSFSPTQVASQTYPFAEKLVDSIRSANPCTVPLFYMTWGRQNGDASNCANYPPICTFDGMNARLRESYLEMAVDNQSQVAPVGAAWKYVRDTYPTINLYNADQSHPSLAGSYLAACVHYAMIFKKSPVGSSFISTLNSTDAANLQLAAKLVVLDSLEKWMHTPEPLSADFTVSQIINSVDFQSNSVNATDFLWNFGDGNTSNLENPQHTYANAGNYTVQLIASNECETDTATLSVVISGISSIEEPDFLTSMLITQQHIIIEHTTNEMLMVKMYSYEGKLVHEQSSSQSTITLSKPMNSGIYFIEISSKNDTAKKVVKKVFVL
jgi:PKD repeat protein